MRFLVASIVLLSLLRPTAAEEIRIVTYNIESGSDTQPHLVAETMGSMGRADIWLLQEVAKEDDVFELLNRTGPGRWNYIFS